YGVGFDLRVDDWSKKYDSIMSKLEIKLKALAAKNPSEVSVTSVSFEKYTQEIQSIKNAFLKIRTGFDNGSIKQNRIVIKYNDFDHPLIVPFYRLDTIVRF